VAEGGGRPNGAQAAVREAKKKNVFVKKQFTRDLLAAVEARVHQVQIGVTWRQSPFNEYQSHLA
jgi:hypothetical protein